MITDYSETQRSIDRVREDIAEAAIAAGRDPASVRLIAVSKTKPVAQISAAIDAGQRDFGENYLDEAVGKIDALQSRGCHWHFIGHIQSNKTRHVAAHFDWAHCIDREKIAQRLSAQRPNGKSPLKICIQVNIDGEASKSGVTPHALKGLAHTIADLPGIELRGLMAIPQPRTDFDDQRQPFARLRALFEQLRTTHPTMDTLSIGMSNDLRAAIAEGATMVRIGTAIFGARPPR